MPKPKFAVYWAASCGGCEIAFLDIREKILDFDAAADLVFCPCIMDTKYKDIEAMAEHEIDVTLLLRQKSKVLVAFGSCATEGCIPGLANLTTKEEILDYAYRRSPSVEAGNTTMPRTVTETPTGRLTLPDLFEVLRPLDQLVDVDYRMPGCPPVAEQIWAVAEAALTGKLPPKGSLVGVNPKTVCDECKRTKEEKKVKIFRRPHLVDPKSLDPKKCLLEQGLICNGPAVHAGCEALCPQVNLGCRGCYGPADGIQDVGAKLAGSIASIIDSDDPAEIQAAVDQIVDPVGTFYRFGLAGSLVGRRIR
jgi:F420-non-reducing hydrogenase small subunit